MKAAAEVAGNDDSQGREPSRSAPPSLPILTLTRDTFANARERESDSTTATTRGRSCRTKYGRIVGCNYSFKTQITIDDRPYELLYGKRVRGY